MVQVCWWWLVSGTDSKVNSGLVGVQIGTGLLVKGSVWN